MPHYKDGTEAKVGDFVKGKPYNTSHEVTGRIVSITPEVESCNCSVAWVESSKAPPEASPGDKLSGGIVITNVAAGNTPALLTPKVDYGETKSFEKVC